MPFCLVVGVSKPVENWQNVIWRAWRHTRDREFADRLFETVADEPVGWGVTVSLLLLGAFYGAAAGLAGGLIATNWDIAVNKDLVSSWQRLLPFVLWGMGVGGLLMWFIRVRIGRLLTWREWLKWLILSDHPSKLSVGLVGVMMYGILGVVLGFALFVVMFGGFGGILFGDWGFVLGVVLAGVLVGVMYGRAGGLVGVLVGVLGVVLLGGLFVVVFGGLGSGLGDTLGDFLLGVLVGSLFSGWDGGWRGDLYAWDHRRRLWWWRGRVHPFVLVQALRQACIERDAARERWVESLRRLETVRHDSRPLDELLMALRHEDWMERFVARYALLALGREAVESLRALLSDSETDVRGMAADLIKDITEDT